MNKEIIRSFPFITETETKYVVVLMKRKHLRPKEKEQNYTSQDGGVIFHLMR